MNKLMLVFSIIISVWFMVSAQITIPIPSGLLNSATVENSEGIGDFDGDGFNDVAVRWIDSTWNSFSVYSFNKSVHLLIVSKSVPAWDLAYAVDLNNDGKVEIIIKNKIYSYSTTDTKKKLP